MKDETRRSLQREGVSFFGAVGAGLSHELSNVLNIINELSGLQQDIVAAAGDGGSAGLARVADLAARVKSQAIRGEEINRSLHRLSHTVDDPDVSFDLGDALALFESLAARAARLAEVELEVRPPAGPLAHRGDPFALQMVLHACLRAALAGAASGRRIEVWAEGGGDAARVIMSSSDPVPGLESDASIAAALELGVAVLGTLPRLEPGADAGQRIVLELANGAAGDGVEPDDGAVEV